MKVPGSNDIALTPEPVAPEAMDRTEPGFVPWLSAPIEDNARLREVGHDYLPTSFVQGFGVSVTEGWRSAFLNPLSRLAEISAETDQGEYQSPMDDLGLLRAITDEPRKLSPMLTEEEWKSSSYFRKGLSFPGGVRERVAEILAERHDAEMIRQDVKARAPGGIAKVGYFLGNLIGQALDPVNVGLAFIPVVGEARYAGMVAKYGKTLARAGRGIAEGVTGAAIQEPMVSVANRQEQLDYTMVDSLVNVAVGGIFGGGLHVGLGRLGDWVESRLTPEAKETILRTALAHLAKGEEVNVEPVVKAFGGEVPKRADFEILSEEPPSKIKGKRSTAEGIGELGKAADAERKRAFEEKTGKLFGEHPAVEGQIASESMAKGDVIVTASDVYRVNDTGFGASLKDGREIHIAPGESIEGRLIPAKDAKGMDLEGLREDIQARGEAEANFVLSKGTGAPSEILTFIRKNGGIRESDVASGNAQRYSPKELGTTGILSKNGMEPDRMRERLVEGGYLEPDSTLTDLWDLIDGELFRRGKQAVKPNAAPIDINSYILAQEVEAHHNAPKSAEDAAFSKEADDVLLEKPNEPDAMAQVAEEDIQRLDAAGRLTDADRASLAEADQAIADSTSVWDQAIKTLANCIVRTS